MWVKLTLTDGRDIFVNLDNVSDIIQDARKTKSHLSFGVGDYDFAVKESPTEILKKAKCTYGE